MAQDVTLDVIARLDQLEKQLKSVFGRPYPVTVIPSRESLGKIRTTFDSFIGGSPIRLNNIGVATGISRGIKSALQSALNSTPLYINNIQLGAGAATSLRRSIQQAIGSVSTPSTVIPGSSGGRAGRGGQKLPFGKIEVDDFSKSIDAASARVAAFGITAGVFLVVKRGIQELVGATFELDKSLREINVLLNLTTSDLQKFGNDLFTIAKNTATGFDIVSTAALEFSRQGLSVEETLLRTNAALNLTRLSGLDSVKAVEALTTALNSFTKEGLTASQVTDKLAAVDAVAATSAGGLAEGLSRVGSAASDAGVSFDELLALIASAKQITGRSESVIGNAFKTIFTRLDREKVKDVIGNTVDITPDESALSILKKLADNYDTLSRSQQAYVAETVAGVFQINQFKAIIADLGSEFSIFDRAQQAAQNSLGISDKRVKVLTKSLSDLAQIAGTNIQQAAAAIGNQTIANPIRDILTGFNNFSDSIGGTFDRVATGNATQFEEIGVKVGAGILKGIGSVITGPGGLIALLAISKVLLQISSLIRGSIGTVLNLNKVVNARLITEQSILGTIQAQNAALGKQTSAASGANIVRGGSRANSASPNNQTVITGGNNFKGKLVGAGLLAPIIAEIAAQGFSGQNKTGRGSSALLGGLGNIAGLGLTGGAVGGAPGAILGVLAGTVLSFNKVLDGFTSDIPDIQSQLDASTKQFNEFETLSQSILSLQSNYDDLSQNVKAGSKAQSQLVQIQQSLSAELSKLPDDLRVRFSRASSFEDRQNILAENSNRLSLNKSFEELAKGLAQAKEERSNRLNLPSLGMISSIFGGFASISQFRGGIEEEFSSKVRALGEELGKNSALSSTQIKDLADGAKTAEDVLRILGIDGKSNVSKFILELQDVPLGVQTFVQSVRQGAQSLTKVVKEVTNSLSKQVKLDVSGGAFLRDKNAAEGVAELKNLGKSTNANRQNLDVISPLTLERNAIVDNTGKAVADAVTQALQRNDAIKGNINDIKKQLELSGFDPKTQSEFLERFLQKSNLGKEFLTNNRVILGATTAERTGSILNQSRLTGIDNTQQQALIQAAIQKSISSGDPTAVQKIIDQFREKSTRSTTGEKDDLNALIASLEIFVQSIKQNKPQVGALTDVVAAVEQQIDTATIDIAKATISIPDVSLPAFVPQNLPAKAPRAFPDQRAASLNPLIDLANPAFTTLNLPNLSNQTNFLPKFESNLSSTTDSLEGAIIKLTEKIGGINLNDPANLPSTQTSDGGVNIDANVNIANVNSEQQIREIAQQVASNIEAKLLSALQQKGINIKLVPLPPKD